MGRRITLNLLFSLTVSSTIKGLLNAVKDLVVTLLGNAVTCVDEVQFGRSSSYLSASLGHAIASPSSTLSSSALDFAALHGVSIAPRVTFIALSPHAKPFHVSTCPHLGHTTPDALETT